MATDKKAESTTAGIVHGADGTTGPTEAESADGTDSAASETESDALSLDIIFEILRNRRRQLVLEFLRDEEGTVTIGELAEHIAAIENETTVRQLNAQQRKRVYIGLYQCHLPKMDDVDVIEFNQSRGRISPGKHIDPLYEYLDVANGETDDEADGPPFERKHGAGFAAFTLAFFVAQAAGAYALASALVLLLVAATLAVVSPRF